MNYSPKSLYELTFLITNLHSEILEEFFMNWKNVT